MSTSLLWCGAAYWLMPEPDAIYLARLRGGETGVIARA
jgi:hypothetical protein